jgi:hypothetical protein
MGIQIEDVFGADHALVTGDRRGEAVRHRLLPGLGAARDDDVETRDDRAWRNCTAAGLRLPRSTRSLRRDARTTNLRTFTALRQRLIRSSTAAAGGHLARRVGERLAGVDADRST